MSEEKRLPTFEEYERDWKRKHRTSIPRKRRVSSIQEIFWIVFWVAVATAAAVFSAVHTIPAAEMTIFKNIDSRAELARLVFMIVELVIFGATAGRYEIKWLVYLLGCALTVALAGNISSSIQAVGQNGGDVLNQLVGVLLAIIAPVTALAAGEVLHIQIVKLETKRSEAQDEYDAAMREMEAKIVREHTKLIKEFERESQAKQDTLLSQPSVSVRTTTRYSTQSSSESAATILARKMIEAGLVDASNAALKEHFGGMSDSTISGARKIVREGASNGHSSNGHSEV